jgi:hypothetical protein
MIVIEQFVYDSSIIMHTGWINELMSPSNKAHFTHYEYYGYVGCLAHFLLFSHLFT